MNQVEANGYINRHVKVAPHSKFPRWGVGILRETSRGMATVDIKGSQGHDDCTIECPIQQLKRWNRGEQLDRARVAAIGAAAGAAEVEGIKIGRAAGLPVENTFGGTAEAFRDKCPDNNGKAEMILVNTKTGTVKSAAPKLSEVSRPNICPQHGHDLPCGDCRAAADRRAMDTEKHVGGGRLNIPVEAAVDAKPPEKTPEEIAWENYGTPNIIMDQISGRVWGGPDRGFIDGVQSAEAAIQWAQRMSQRDAKRWATNWKTQPGSRGGQYYPSGLIAVTTDEALNILTDPKRKFSAILPAGVMPKAGEGDKPAAGANGSNGKASAAVDEASGLEAKITAMAARVAEASRTVKKSEAAQVEAERAAGRIAATLEAAKADAERIERETRAYRAALGTLKAEMMELIESQG